MKSGQQKAPRGCQAIAGRAGTSSITFVGAAHQVYSSQRHAALALLNRGGSFTRKAAHFLGQLALDASPMTEAQSQWLDKLLARAGLPPFEEGGH